MKKYLPLILTSILLYACDNKTSESQTISINSSPEKNNLLNQNNVNETKNSTPEKLIIKNTNKISKINKIDPIIKSISSTFAESVDGNYIIEWKTIPEDITVNQYFKVEFLIKEPMKSINYQIDLLVDAGMQEHNHGMHTKPIVKRYGKQHFISEGMLFHMPGTWQIELEISRGIIKEKAIIEVML